MQQPIIKWSISNKIKDRTPKKTTSKPLKMKFILCAVLALLTLTNCAEKNRSFNSTEIAILPKPVFLDLHEASFAFKDGQTVFMNLEEQQTAAKDLETLRP